VANGLSTTFISLAGLAAHLPAEASELGKVATVLDVARLCPLLGHASIMRRSSTTPEALL